MRKKAIVVLLSIFILTTAAGCSVSITKNDSQSSIDIDTTDFNSFCEDLISKVFVTDSFSSHFTIADEAKYGISFDESDYSFGNYSLEENNASIEECKDLFNKLKNFNRDKLSEEEQLTYDILYKYFETAVMYEGTLALNNVFAPSSGIIANLSTNFVEFNFYDEEDIEMYLTYLKDTERYMQQLFDFAKEQSDSGYFMPDYIIDQVIEQCQGYIDAENDILIITFDNKINEMDLADDVKNEYIEMNKEYVETYYAPVYQETIDLLESLKGTCENDGGLCNFGKIGKNYYNAIIKDKTSSDYTADELIDMLDEEMNEIIMGMSAIYMADPKTYNDFNSYQPDLGEPEEILDFLIEEMTADFPAPLITDYNIEYQDKSCEIEGTIAYYVTCRIDDVSINNMKINGSAVENDPLMLYTTMAHEGYPGHLYEYTTFFSDNKVSDIRKLTDFIGATEGWAEYVAYCALDYLDISDNMKKLIILNDAFSYVLISRLDIGVNYEGWTMEDAQDYLDTYIEASSTDVEDLYYTVIGDPGLFFPYTIGSILMNDMREEAEDELQDDFDAVEYHKWLLSVGVAPFSVYEDELEKWLDK